MKSEGCKFVQSGTAHLLTVIYTEDVVMGTEQMKLIFGLVVRLEVYSKSEDIHIPRATVVH
jgi:hypothetical protein